jgi:hypothetical protein
MLSAIWLRQRLSLCTMPPVAPTDEFVSQYRASGRLAAVKLCDAIYQIQIIPFEPFAILISLVAVFDFLELLSISVTRC